MMTETSWKHDTFWGAIFFTFLATLALAGFIGSRWQKEQPEPIYLQTVYTPVPCHDYTMEMHELEILREAVRKDQENREAKDFFNSPEMQRGPE